MPGFESISEKFGRAKEYDVTEKQDVQMESGKGSCRLGYRHLVSLWCFFYFFNSNCTLSTLPITIVAMVNHSQPTNEIRHRNASIGTCPLPARKENTSAKPRLEGSFNWDSKLQGYALAAAPFGYMISNFFSGRIAETYGAKRTLWVGDFCSIVCTCIFPFAARLSIYALIVIQFIRALMMGAIIPSVFVIMANWFPCNERGLLSSFGVCGAAIGNAIAGSVFGALSDIPSLGWQSAYYFLGGFNFCMSMIFLLTFYEVPKVHPHISKEELKYIVGDQESDMAKKRPPAPWKEICTSIPVHALNFGKIGLYWSVAHFAYMHPTFMGTVLHFSMTENGLNSSLLFIAMTVGSAVSIISSNWLRKKKYLGVDQLRKCSNSISAFGFSLCVAGVMIGKCNKTTNLVCSIVALFFTGIGVSGSMIAAGDMSPVFSGSISGISSCIAMFASSVMPVIVGALTKNGTLDEWQIVFGIHIAVTASCGLIFHIFGSANIQPWNSVGSAESTNYEASVGKRTSQVDKSQFKDESNTN